MAKGGKNFKKTSLGCNTEPPLLNANEKKQSEKEVSFSFKYFRQIDFCGIGNCNNKWFVGLIERLGSLSAMTYKELGETKGSSSTRLHAINWEQKNMPISKSDLNWLPNYYLDNEVDYPIVQISISISTGRIIGFFDENQVFNIVLLDPNHNIQPSQMHNYQLQPTTIGISEYDDLINKVENIKKSVADCTDKSCLIKEQIQDIPLLHDNVIMAGVDSDFYEQYLEVIKRHSVKDIIENGIMQLMK